MWSSRGSPRPSTQAAGALAARSTCWAWPAGITARPADESAPIDAVERSIARGAVIAAIGPLTNLAALESHRPGALTRAQDAAMAELGRAHPRLPDELVNFHCDPTGREVRIITDIDGPAFTATWFARVETAARGAGHDRPSDPSPATSGIDAIPELHSQM